MLVISIEGIPGLRDSAFHLEAAARASLCKRESPMFTLYKRLPQLGACCEVAKIGGVAELAQKQLSSINF